MDEKNVSQASIDIRQSSYTQGLYIFPTINNGNFQIEWSDEKITSGNVIMQVLDGSGKVIWNKTVAIEDDEINEDISLGNYLPDGLYIIRLQTPQSIITGKVMVIR